MRRAHWLMATAGLALWGGATPASAQIATDGTLGPAGAISAVGGVYNIPQSLGSTSGTNLFHSFSDFSVPAGTEARFTGAASLTNVIARVTGGSVSDIDGLLSLYGPSNADLYFINPAGIVIGANAFIDVPGAMYFSTANELRFADNRSFAAVAQTPSGALSMAAPSSFGFLSASSGDIDVINSAPNLDGANDLIPLERLELVAANIEISNSLLLGVCYDPAHCNGGLGPRIELLAVGNGPANVTMSAAPD